MEGLIKIAFAIVISYFIVSWALDNPKKANTFVDKVEHAYAYTVSTVSDFLLDEKNGE